MFICNFDFSALLCSQISSWSADKWTGYPTRPLNRQGLCFPPTSIPISLNSLSFVGRLVSVGWFYLPCWKFRVIFILSPSSSIHYHQVPFFLPSKCHLLDSVFHPHLSWSSSLRDHHLSFLHYLPDFGLCSFQFILHRIDRLSFLKHCFSVSKWLSDSVPSQP